MMVEFPSVQWRSWLVRSIAPLIVFTVATVTAVAVYGSVSAAMDRVRGFAARPVRQEIDLGTLTVGDSKTCAISIQNLLGSPLAIIGAKTDCGCAVASGLPLEIPPYAVGEFSIVVAPSIGEAGDPFDRSVLLILDAESRPVEVRLVGTIRFGTP